METYRLQLCKPGFVITPNEKTTKQNQKPKPIKKDHVNLYWKKKSAATSPFVRIPNNRHTSLLAFTSLFFL